MSNEFDRFHLYSGIIRRLLLFTGLWPTPNPTSLYRLVFLFNSSVSFLTCCALFNFCYHHVAQLHLFLKGLGLGLSFLTILQKLQHLNKESCQQWKALVIEVTEIFECTVIIVVKMSCLMFYRQRLVKLHADLAMTFHMDLNDIELRPILLSPLLSFYPPSFILSTVTYLVIVLYWITPILSIVIQRSRGVDVLKLILPFPASYPWQTNSNPWLYLGHYTFEIYAGICLGAFTSSIDALFGFYIFQICGQLRTLSYRIKNMKSNDNYRKVISECMSRHQILTRCQDHLERIYGPIVLWMLVTNAMVMCALIYQAAHVSPAKAAIIGLYIVLKSVQTLVYGWFGSFLENENNMFREAIYASDWAGSGEKCLMTDVLIMMTYKPFVLKACSLSNISIDMFVAVSNTAISYYFMLRTLEEQD